MKEGLKRFLYYLVWLMSPVFRAIGWVKGCCDMLALTRKLRKKYSLDEIYSILDHARSLSKDEEAFFKYIESFE